MVEKQAMGTFLQPLFTNSEQSKPKLLLPAHGPVFMTRHTSILVSYIEQRLAHGGAVGVDGEPPEEKLQQGLQFWFHGGQEPGLEMLETLGEL